MLKKNDEKFNHENYEIAEYLEGKNEISQIQDKWRELEIFEDIEELLVFYLKRKAE